MADLQHDALTHAQVHEPKWITLSNTADTGKVITSSSVTPAISEYRKLKQGELSEVRDFINLEQPSATSAAEIMWPCPFSGTIINWYIIQETTLTTAANVYELRINGVTVTGTPLTVLLAGAVGDQYTAAASALNTFTAGQRIGIKPTTVGNTDATAHLRFVIQVQRS
jgi:hypothetical protein